MHSIHCLVAGFPAKSRTHAGMGWSSVYLVSDGRRNILVDTGPPAYTSLLQARLAGLGLSTADVSDVLVTHLHWDHVSNFTMFENASIVVFGVELDWAAASLRELRSSRTCMSPGSRR